MTNKKTILVVEDQKVLAMMTQSWLEDIGTNVVLASNGIKAKNCLMKQPIDIVITDLVMPEMDGLGLLNWMKKHDINLPTIVISGISDKDQLDEIKQFSNVIKILEKPLTMDQLIDVQIFIDG